MAPLHRTDLVVSFPAFHLYLPRFRRLFCRRISSARFLSALALAAAIAFNPASTALFWRTGSFGKLCLAHKTSIRGSNGLDALGIIFCASENRHLWTVRPLRRANLVVTKRLELLPTFQVFPLRFLLVVRRRAPVVSDQLPERDTRA